MSKLLKMITGGTYTLGNYSITHEHGEWTLLPIKPTKHGKSAWIEGTIKCDTREDAFRIAMVFTGEDLVNQTMREMFALYASERKEGNA